MLKKERDYFAYLLCTPLEKIVSGFSMFPGLERWWGVTRSPRDLSAGAPLGGRTGRRPTGPDGTSTSTWTMRASSSCAPSARPRRFSTWPGSWAVCHRSSLKRRMPGRRTPSPSRRMTYWSCAWRWRKCGRIFNAFARIRPNRWLTKPKTPQRRCQR